jgi:hypothetical protein
MSVATTCPSGQRAANQRAINPAPAASSRQRHDGWIPRRCRMRIVSGSSSCSTKCNRCCASRAHATERKGIHRLPWREIHRQCPPFDANPTNIICQQALSKPLYGGALPTGGSVPHNPKPCRCIQHLCRFNDDFEEGEGTGVRLRG